MNDFLCDFSFCKEHISNYLKYTYGLDTKKAFATFLKEMFRADITLDDNVYIEECNLLSKDFSDTLFVLVQFVIEEFTKTSPFLQDYIFVYHLISSKYNPEKLTKNDINELKSQKVSLNQIGSVIKEFANKLPPRYKYKEEFIEFIKSKLPYYLKSYEIEDETSNYEIQCCIFEIIDDQISNRNRIYHENIDHELDKKDVEAILNHKNTLHMNEERISLNKDDKVTKDKVNKPGYGWSSLIQQNEPNLIAPLIKETLLETYYSSIMANLLQIELTKGRYNRYEKYTKYVFEDLYSVFKVMNGLYKGYKNKPIKQMLMGEYKTDTRKRLCYIPFAGIDFVAMNYTLFTIYSKKRVIYLFWSYILNTNISFKKTIKKALKENDYSSFIEELIDPSNKAYYSTEDYNNIYNIIDNYIKSKLKDYKEANDEDKKKITISVYDMLKTKKGAKDEDEKDNTCYDIILDIILNLVDKKLIDKYELYDVDIIKLHKSLISSYDAVSSNIQCNTDMVLSKTYPITTPYMIERLYGINLCEEYYKNEPKYSYYQDAEVLFQLTKVQNINIRKILFNIYLEKESYKDHVLKLTKYESEWIYPLLMYFVELYIELYTKQLKNSIHEFCCNKENSEHINTELACMLNDIYEKTLKNAQQSKRVKKLLNKKDAIVNDLDNVCKDIIVLYIANEFNQGKLKRVEYNKYEYIKYSHLNIIEDVNLEIKNEHTATTQLFYKKLMKCYETPESRKESFECFKLKHGFLDPYYDDNFFK